MHRFRRVHQVAHDCDGCVLSVSAFVNADEVPHAVCLFSCSVPSFSGFQESRADITFDKR